MYGKIYICPCRSLLRVEIIGETSSIDDFKKSIGDMCNTYCSTRIASNMRDSLMNLTKSSRCGYSIENKNIRICKNCSRVIKPVTSIVTIYNEFLRNTLITWKDILQNYFEANGMLGINSFVRRVIDKVEFDVSRTVIEFGQFDGSIVTTSMIGENSSFLSRRKLYKVDTLYIALTKDELKTISIDIISWKANKSIIYLADGYGITVPWERNNGTAWLKDKFNELYAGEEE